METCCPIRLSCLARWTLARASSARSDRQTRSPCRSPIEACSTTFFWVPASCMCIAACVWISADVKGDDLKRIAIGQWMVP
eukprot:CCRYP_010239-RC/>CCRYP_010239-RC protein AED:0.48 eAED:1.00 QI:0/0/0/1/0/0/2/0/80